MAGSRRIIPREELSEFQRWQFSSLLGGQHLAPEPEPESEAQLPEPEPVVVEPEPVVPEETPEEALVYPTAEEIAAIEQQAHEEGYQAGLELGRQQAEAELLTLQGLLTGLDAAAEAVESTLAAEVLDLALVISRQLVRREISADRTLVLDVIREAVATLPAAKAPARILLNADDLEVVAPLLATELHDDVWRFIADPSMEPGACRIESPSSSVDLTLASRWQSILRVLGRESAAGLDWADDLPDETDESPAP